MPMLRKKPKVPSPAEVCGIWRGKSYGPPGGSKESLMGEEIEEELL